MLTTPLIDLIPELLPQNIPSVGIPSTDMILVENITPPEGFMDNHIAMKREVSGGRLSFRSKSEEINNGLGQSGGQISAGSAGIGLYRSWHEKLNEVGSSGAVSGVDDIEG